MNATGSALIYLYPMDQQPGNLFSLTAEYYACAEHGEDLWTIRGSRDVPLVYEGVSLNYVTMDLEATNNVTMWLDPVDPDLKHSRNVSLYSGSIKVCSIYIYIYQIFSALCLLCLTGRSNVLGYRHHGLSSYSLPYSIWSARIPGHFPTRELLHDPCHHHWI